MKNRATLFLFCYCCCCWHHKNHLNYKKGRKSNQIERVNVFLYYWRYSTCHAVKKIRKSIFHCMSSSALLAKSLVNACKHRCIDTTGYSRYHTPTISCQYVAEVIIYWANIPHFTGWGRHILAIWNCRKYRLVLYISQSLALCIAKGRMANYVISQM